MNRSKSLAVVVLLFATVASLLSAAGCVKREAEPTTSSRTDIESAERLYDGGQFGAAVQVLERVVARDPADLDARRRLGLVYAAQGKVEQAIRQYSAVAENSPKDDVTMYRLALLQRQAGELTEAETLLERAVEQRPDEEAYLEELARTRARAGKHAAAIKVWERLLRETSVTGARRVAMLVECGQSYLDLKRPAEARRLLAEAERLEPRNVTVKRMLRRVP